MSGTRKVVINRCYGGFSLSPKAVKRLAELQGRECYFFVNPTDPIDIHKYVPASLEEAADAFLFWAFDTPHTDRLKLSTDEWFDMSFDERKAHNEMYEQHSLDNRPRRRDDPLLVQVVEELGEAANGKHAELRVVEIPADVDYEIDEYDGIEHIAEKHRTWPGVDDVYPGQEEAQTINQFERL